MRIVICDYSGFPGQVELSRCLARRGHPTLHLHFAQFPTPKGLLVVTPEDPPEFAVEGLRLARFDKQDFLRRRLWEAQFGRLAARRALDFAPDVVVGCNMPLDAQNNFQRRCMAHGVPFVFWLEDVYSAAIRHFLTQKAGVLGSMIGARYMRLERRLLRASTAVIAVSAAFLPQLAEWGVPAATTEIIPNWAPMSMIRPTPKDNAWARRHSLADKLVAVYTGTLGLKHDPLMLCRLAQRGQAIGLSVVVASQGPAIDWLAQQKQQHGLANLLLLPYQPIESYAEVLATGDILLALLKREAAGFCVPSKVLGYLAAGRPTVAAMEADNDAAVALAEADAGVVTPAGDAERFCDAVLDLAGDPERRRGMGERARAYAEREFDIEPIADRFEARFRRVVRPAQSRGGRAEPAPSLRSAG